MNALQALFASCPCGFILDHQIPQLITLDRLFPVLVRCGGCRFTCAVQYLEHLERCIKAGGDHIRDVSFPVGSEDRAAAWQPPIDTRPAIHRLPDAWAISRDLHPATFPPHDSKAYYDRFNESDCGGAFDGNQVTSDADSGL